MPTADSHKFVFSPVWKKTTKTRRKIVRNLNNFQVRSDDNIFLISEKCRNLKSRISVSNFKSRVSNSEFLMKSLFRSRLVILNRSPSRSRSLWSRLHHCYVATTAWKYSCEFRPTHFRSILDVFARVEFANPRWSSCSLMAVVRVSRTFNLL